MSVRKTFALIGVAGYVAPRHLRAIKENGGELVAALDRSDSVGVIDSSFPNARFFTEFERFDRFVDLRRRQGKPLDYVSICSPNYLHDAHVRFALRSGADAICEKPLVLNPHNVDGLAEIERDTGRRIFTILHLRLLPAIIALKERIAAGPKDKVHDVDLTYVTPRGQWYYQSWKGDEAKSGGIATNIGVHFFDMLRYVFGEMTTNIVHHRAIDCAAGYLEFEKARVRWYLSINERDMPVGFEAKFRTFRSITVDGAELEFSEGFRDMHEACYREILAGRGFPISEVRPNIEMVAAIRNQDILLDEGVQHPLVAKVRGDSSRYADGRPV